ncbi:hypothetical protein GQ54DRAFT_296933 [Martensiomyces pterosporus]|nr:hypothetical protein GQ54DRAFT_296933 [Martensiomyces pterosporus]
MYPAEQQSKQTAFRRAEKIYKARNRQPDMSQVVDVSKPHLHPDIVSPVRLTRSLKEPPGTPFKVFSEQRPPAYALRGHPGLLVIPNPLTDEAQRWLARKCLCDCAKPPNHTNLDPFFDLPPKSLFALSSNPCSTNIANKDAEGGVTKPKDKFYTQPQPAAMVLERLRWCTLGQQYNWTTKKYDSGHSTFDSEIDGLMKAVAVAATSPEMGERPAGSKGGDEVAVNDYEGANFASQAGIVNYYGERDFMSGHVDKTEENMDAPLISLSCGLSCVYLIGGATRDVEPTAIYLRSGDVLAMCGESRLAFHGVPLIIPDSSPAYLCDSEAGTHDAVANVYPEWQHFAQYLSHHRINCNARKCT